MHPVVTRKNKAIYLAAKGLMNQLPMFLKGNQLCLAIRTDSSETATWEIDAGPLGRVGLTPILEVRRPL